MSDYPLKNGKTKEEMDNEAIQAIHELGRAAELWRHRMANDPAVIAARKEYAERKAAGEFPDETS